MSKYKILAIIMVAVMTSVFAACGRTESGNEVSPIVQTVSAETVTENTSVTSETEMTAETVPDESNELDEETAEMLRRELAEYINETDPLYAQFDPSRAVIEEYYGKYSGCEVFRSIYSGGEEALDYYSVAGYGMIFPCLGYSIYVHKDGDIWELDAAYEEGIISEEDVAKIAEKHNGVPTEKSNTLLSDAGSDRAIERSRKKELAELRREFAEYISETDPFYRDIDPSSIKFESYYGTYNGCEVFLPLYKLGYDDAEDWFTIAGHEMYFPCLGYEIYVYKDGEFYELEDAYEKGYISEADIAQIAEGNHARYFFAFQ